jgi:hypothetical protein
VETCSLLLRSCHRERRARKESAHNDHTDDAGPYHRSYKAVLNRSIVRAGADFRTRSRNFPLDAPLLAMAVRTAWFPVANRLNAFGLSSARAPGSFKAAALRYVNTGPFIATNDLAMTCMARDAGAHRGTVSRSL